MIVNKKVFESVAEKVKKREEFYFKLEELRKDPDNLSLLNELNDLFAKAVGEDICQDS